MAIRVADVMQKSVRSVHPDMPVRDLEQWLVSEHVTGAPVVEGGRLVGVVSRSDVVRQLVVEETLAGQLDDPARDPDETPAREESEAFARAVAGRWVDLKVRDVMIEGVISVAPEAPVAEAARVMADRHVHRVVVLDGERIAGIVSSMDLIRLVAEERLG